MSLLLLSRIDDLEDNIKTAISQEVDLFLKDLKGTSEQTVKNLKKEALDVFYADFAQDLRQTLIRDTRFRGDKGEQGPKGEQGKGKDGRNGKDGRDGKELNASVVAEQVLKILPTNEKPVTDIARALENLPDKDKLSVAAIRGLQQAIEQIKREVQRKAGGGGGGGGMGNVQTQTFSISASTTTVTTDFPIGQSGNAIMNFVYDNANLERTNHYTVGSDRKTITFDSDVTAQFVDNSSAYITYVRG